MHVNIAAGIEFNQPTYICYQFLKCSNQIFIHACANFHHNSASVEMENVAGENSSNVWQSNTKYTAIQLVFKKKYENY